MKGVSFKMLFKKIKILALVITLILLTSMVSFSADQIIIKLSHADPANESYSSCHNGALTFKSLVESLSDGRIKVEIYPACQLGGER